MAEKGIHLATQSLGVGAGGEDLERMDLRLKVGSRVVKGPGPKAANLKAQARSRLGTQKVKVVVTRAVQTVKNQRKDVHAEEKGAEANKAKVVLGSEPAKTRRVL
jgi:hypothetical protein